MGISIKNSETERLVRELAALTGKGHTEVITEAIEEKLSRLKRKGMAERLLALGREAAPLFKPPYDTIEHGDLLYDKETGLPK